MTRFRDLITWKPVEEVKWRAVPKLGLEWMCKWTIDEKGYWLVLTDGSALWGEMRTATFILEKAEDWAPCIEAEMQKLSSLVLMDLSQRSVLACWDGREQVVLHISSTLEDFTYKWEFHLSRLPDEVYRHHWVLPLLVQVHSQSQRVRQLEAEVKAKTRQLQELLPDNSKLVNSKKKDVPLEECVELVMMKGTWTVLQEHMETVPSIMKHLTAFSSEPKAGDADNGRDKEKEKAALASSSPTKRMTQEEQEEEQEKRERMQRAKIQEIQQAAPKREKQTKKKKLKL